MDQTSHATTPAADHQTPPPALSPAPPEKRAHNAASHDTSAAARRRRRAAHLRNKVSSSTSAADSCNAVAGEEEEVIKDEKVEVEKKIAALQRIVPGGETLAVDKLFEETAEYIMALECQVEALRFLAAFVVQGSDKQKRKLGG